MLAGCGASTLHGGRPHAAGFAKPPSGDYGLSGRLLSARPSIPGYDAVTLSNIPAHPAAVGCYSDGRYANCGEAMRRFPLAHIVSIDVRASDFGARCLDVEPGDAHPSDAGPWSNHEIRIGIYRPCIYSDASEMPSVRSSIATWGATGKVLLWLADWDGRSAIPSGFDAKQWFSNCCIDRDTFATYFFKARPKPKPPRLHCFGSHARPNDPICRRVRPRVAKWSRAEASSRRAYQRQGCPILTQRIAWFSHAIKTQPRSHRTGRRRAALAASTRVYRRDGCPVFAQRADFFAARVKWALATY